MRKSSVVDIQIRDLMNRRILVLDGAMGTMIQNANLCEDDFRGEEWKNSERELKGCNDLLVLTRPDVIGNIHKMYLDAGADIITSNSFNANAVSLADYDLQDEAYRINRTAAELACGVRDEWCAANGDAVKFVAGSVGPTNKSLTMSPSVDDPAARNMTWAELTDAYTTQICGLLDGGVDLLLMETVFDTLNVKAALWAADEAMNKVGRRVPLMVSVTLTESGRTLSGQTLEAFVASVSHASLLTIGINCGFGAEGMAQWVEELAAITPCYICVYPNAGLPNEMGEYDETPTTMVEHVSRMLKKGVVNIIGGCCGTTPEHIRMIAEAVKGFEPRKVDTKPNSLRLSGLEHLDINSDTLFVNIGERCNVAGSRKFLRLVNDKQYGEALEIAIKQVEAGAQVVDVNMDDGMLDTEAEMVHFLRLMASEPDVARVPVMIDSSKWNVIKAGLECLQGKGIVNSISLKDGEEKFKAKAEHIKRMGAATVVMAFDEKGQADTYERKIEVCGRAYRILTQEVGFEPTDIIFDPNILAIATGIEDHNNYGKDFISAVEWIKTNLPGAKVSGGVSNLSFSFRGNNAVRQAMHSVFLYYAIEKGMDMAIVNAGAIVPYDDIEPTLRKAIEDVIFNTDSEATDRLITIAQEIKDKATNATETEKVETESNLTPSERLKQMIVRGRSEGLEDVLAVVHNELGSALAVIDGPLMDGMNQVGELFGSGKLFLPQVVKSARTMKQAVNWLNPYIEEEKRTTDSDKKAGKLVIATVKGDVHDIGKNIVTVIMRCNGYEVIDMGVMVPGEDIVDKAIAENADLIGLSGLITPSLDEMCRVAGIMQERGLNIPLMVGGATTSAIHTAVKIAPNYDGPVVYTRDAAMMPTVAQQLLTNREAFMKDWRAKQEELRNGLKQKQDLSTIAEARKRKPVLEYATLEPKQKGLHTFEVTVGEARKYINWRPFFNVWKLPADMATIADVKGCDCNRGVWLAEHCTDDMNKAAEAMQLYKEANKMLDHLQEVADDSIKAVVGMFKAYSEAEAIVIAGENTERIETLRQQKKNDSEASISLSDFVAPKESGIDDYVGVFAVTVGEQINNMIKYQQGKGDDYKALLLQSLADRLVEAATEFVHKEVRTKLWGYAENEESNPTNLLRQYYQGIRPAVGYPSLPDQSEIFKLDRLVGLNSIGIELTENGAMNPAASTCGLMIAHPSSRYFIVGEIGEDQRKEYARRKGWSDDELKKWLR